MSYSFSGRIRYSEIGQQGRLTLHHLVNYFQDCSTFHTQSLGKIKDCRETPEKVWVMSAWQIVIRRLPDLGEEVTAATWPYAFKNFTGSRNFTLHTKEELLACANSIWTLIDAKTGVPSRLSPENTDGYDLEEKFDMDYAPRKIALPDGLEARKKIVVRPHHLDTNHHVNNAQYIAMAEELLPVGFPVGQLRVEYKKQARLDDVICPYVLQREDSFLAALKDEQGESICMIEITAR